MKTWHEFLEMAAGYNTPDTIRKRIVDLAHEQGAHPAHIARQVHSEFPELASINVDSFTKTVNRLLQREGLRGPKENLNTKHHLIKRFIANNPGLTAKQVQQQLKAKLGIDANPGNIHGARVTMSRPKYGPTFGEFLQKKLGGPQYVLPGAPADEPNYADMGLDQDGTDLMSRPMTPVAPVGPPPRAKRAWKPQQPKPGVVNRSTMIRDLLHLPNQEIIDQLAQQGVEVNNNLIKVVRYQSKKRQAAVPQPEPTPGAQQDTRIAPHQLEPQPEAPQQFASYGGSKPQAPVAAAGTKCPVCKGPTTPQELTVYRGRCEDCSTNNHNYDLSGQLSKAPIANPAKRTYAQGVGSAKTL